MNNFEQEYKNAMNDVHASDELRNRIMNMKPQKRMVTPLRTALVSAAAAVMILVVANDYDFTPDTDGVITETVVATQVPQEAVVVEETEAPKVTAPKVQKTPEKPKTDSPQTVNVTENDIEVQTIDETEHSPMTVRHGVAEVTTENWDMNRYFEYIGTNVHSKINSVVTAEYVGDTEFLFVTDQNGVPTQDTVILNYVTASSGSISVTVSKTPMFEMNLSGSVVSSGNGYNGYKVANGVYYMISASGITHDGMIAILNNF